jgi:hypothetical protein
MSRIVNSDNFDGDYPDESFLDLPQMPAAACKVICDEINNAVNTPRGWHPRYWKVVDDDYVLQPGFEP